MVTVPQDLDVERQILGSVLAFPTTPLDDLVAALVPADFYRPAHQAIWAAVVDLYAGGASIDPLTVKDRCGDIVDGAELVAMQANAIPLRREHISIVQRHSLGRRLQSACVETLNAVGEGADPVETTEALRGQIDSLDSPLVAGRLSVSTLDEIVTATESLAPWVIPGLLRADWRVIVVGGEGRGKSVLLRQIAACAAQGVHPFRYGRIAPVRVALIDAENPAGAIAETGREIVQQLRRTVGDSYDPERLQVVRCAGSIDLRRRADRLEIESMLAAQRPQLVVAGPLYQLFARRPKERDDEATEPVLRLLDDWRRRFRFALMLEHHAPHGTPGTPREMRPYGSSLLNRWPELGIGLRTRGESLELGRWRGDRMRNDWPHRLDRGDVYPWHGWWPTAEDDGGAF